MIDTVDADRRAAGITGGNARKFHPIAEFCSIQSVGCIDRSLKLGIVDGDCRGGTYAELEIKCWSYKICCYRFGIGESITSKIATSDRDVIRYIVGPGQF